MSSPANRSTSTPPKRSLGSGVVFGIVIAVVVLVGLVVVLLTAGDDDGDDEASPVPTASAPAANDDATQQSAATIEIPEEYVGEIRPVTVTGTPLPPLDDAGEAVGTIVPTVTGESFDGTPVEIAAGDGHTMVVVLAHWCPHCNNEIPRLIQLQEEGRLPADLRIVGVSTAANAGQPNFPPSEWIVDKGWPWEVLADGVDADGAFLASAAYGVDAFPFVTVFDSNGAVTARWSGESDVDELAEKIDQAVGA
jgi:cytochrome c biogenesis protein CcmG, thiol:disulfide interchange protein DsbE